MTTTREIHIRLDARELAAIKVVAAEDRRTVQNWIRHALGEALAPALLAHWDAHRPMGECAACDLADRRAVEAREERRARLTTVDATKGET